jgi:class 3 adenylate cyclase
MANRLRLLREERGWTTQRLASLLDVSRSTIEAIEKGKYSPTLTLASAMARLFGGRIEDIFPNSPQPNTNGTKRVARVTFVCTDIEGSTRLLADLGPQYVDALEQCRAIIRQKFFERGGRILDEVGDGSLYVFDEAVNALDATASAQEHIASTAWPGGARVRVRMGVHTGDTYVAGEFGERYVGLAVHEAARVCALAHGGETLVSAETAREPEAADRLIVRGEFELAGLEGIRVIHELRPASAS